MELGFSFRVGCPGWRGDGEAGGWEGKVEKWKEAVNSLDGGYVEGSPRPNLADIPPEVLGIAVADMDVELAHKRGGRICSSEIGHQSCVCVLRKEGKGIRSNVE